MIKNIKEENIKEENYFDLALNEQIETFAPNYKKSKISDEEIIKIMRLISENLNVPISRVIVGTYWLFLQGAASSGAPGTMSVPISENVKLDKKTLMDTCYYVTNNYFIRRIAEAKAADIGKFAEINKLQGELAQRINNKHQAQTGSSLSDKELAYCSSFSQSIPNLSEITSPRLAQLLADDYTRRFDKNKKDSNKENRIRNKRR